MADEHEYTLKCCYLQDRVVEIKVEGVKSLKIATPEDFWPESPSGVLSPEDLLVASVASCYGVSLTGAALRFHAKITDFELDAKGRLMQGKFGWEFERIDIEAKIIVPTEKDKKKVSKAAERAHTYCVISNSLKCPVGLNYEIEVQKDPQ